MNNVRTLEYRGHRFKIACVENGPTHASWFSFEDEKEVRQRAWNIAPGDVVFDVGACFGSYTLTALAAGAAKVFAWSPGCHAPGEPTEAELLQQSIELNGWMNRCEVFNWGVFDKIGYLDIETLKFSNANQSIGNYVIPVDLLDVWFNLERDAIPAAGKYWLKIDVEGAEEQVILSGLNLIRELRPTILLENHYFRRPTIEEEVRQLVLSLGYKERETVPHQTISHSLYTPKEIS